jgi:hypothetical protein
VTVYNDIGFGVITQDIEPHVHADQTDADPADLLLVEPVTTHDLEGFVVADGVPVYAGYNGVVELATTTVHPVFTAGDVDPDTITAALDAYARFQPGNSLGVLDGGIDVYLPVGWHSGESYPLAIQRKTHVGVDDGTDTFTYDADSIAGDPDYSYRGRGGETARACWVFNGLNSFGTLFAPTGQPGTFTHLTMAFVAVLHPSDFDYYPIFEWLGDDDTYTQLRHAHGRTSLVKSHLEQVAHESFNGAAHPTILMLSFDADSDTGQLIALDRGRTSLEFGLTDLAYTGITGTIGAARTRVYWPHEGYNRFGDIDLLELDVWNTALSQAELEQKLALLAACYGVPL